MLAELRARLTPAPGLGPTDSSGQVTLTGADVAAARAVLHKLKGSALTLGASAVGACCEAVRQHCIAGNFGAVHAPGGLGSLAALEMATQQVLGAWHRVCFGLGPSPSIPRALEPCPDWHRSATCRAAEPVHRPACRQCECAARLTRSSVMHGDTTRGARRVGVIPPARFDVFMHITLHQTAPYSAAPPRHASPNPPPPPPIRCHGPGRRHRGAREHGGGRQPGPVRERGHQGWGDGMEGGARGGAPVHVHPTHPGLGGSPPGGGAGGVQALHVRASLRGVLWRKCNTDSTRYPCLAGIRPARTSTRACRSSTTCRSTNTCTQSRRTRPCELPVCSQCPLWARLFC